MATPGPVMDRALLRHFDVARLVAPGACPAHAQNRLGPAFLKDPCPAKAGDQYGWTGAARCGWAQGKSPVGTRSTIMLPRTRLDDADLADRSLWPADQQGGPSRAFWWRALSDLGTLSDATDIPEPDRTWFAMAAYNVGIGQSG